MAGDPVLEALWKRVTDAWEDDKTHGAFLAHCQETEQLSEAATRYGGMKGDRERGESAGKRLEGVALLATHAMLASRTEPRKGLPRWFVVGTSVFFGGMLLYVLIRLFRG